MNKTFTVSGTGGTVNVEAATKEEAIVKASVGNAYSVRGPRFTDSLRSKAKKPKPANLTMGFHGTPPEAKAGVLYLGTRAAVRHLARL